MGRPFHPARHHGQRRPHHERGRQQADGASDAAQQKIRHPGGNSRGVKILNQRQSEQGEEATESRSQFQAGVDFQRVVPGGNPAWQQKTAQA